MLIHTGDKKLSVLAIIFLLATMLLQGCSGSSSTNSSSNSSQAKKMSTDVVVVGSGSTGLSAAVQAKQLGLNVIIIEKNPGIGGTSAVTEGYGAINSNLAKEAGVQYKTLDVLKNAENYHHWMANPELLKKYYENSGQTANWLQSLGVQFQGLMPIGKYNTWHLYKGTGKQFTQTLADNAKKMGVKILLDTRGKELIMKDGKVAGIKATQSDGSNLTIKAPVVILATGGYAGNPDMVQKYAKVNSDRVMDAGIPGRTGDGINMALKVGASDKDLKGSLMAFGDVMKGSTFRGNFYYGTCRQPLLRVNQDGNRFVDESMVISDSVGYADVQRQQSSVYEIVSKEELDQFIEKGFPRKEKQPITNFYSELNSLLKKDKSHVFTANSIEELATKIHVDKAQLKTTVDQYNGYAKTGDDTQFGTPANFLIPVEKGPYYAFKFELGYYATTDGLAVTTDAQVLDKKGNVIPGLYAGGGDAGGLNGESYDVMIFPGSQQGWAVNSGRFAAQDAAKYVKK